MTICDKIQTVGNTLEENLNERGVQCTFGKGNGKSSIYDMVRLVNDTNFKGSNDVNLNISANRPYLLAGETTDVVVKLENGLCKPLGNKNITIEQSIFRDNGTATSHNDNWSNTQYMTRNNNGTAIQNHSTETLFEVVKINNSNLGFENTNYIIEFEIVANPSSTNRFRFDGRTICDGESYAHYDFYFNQNETGKFKFVYNKTNNTITKYKNGTLVSTHNHHFCGNMGFLFRVESGASITFKDFVIYKIINGVTDEKGEFALYNVSVINDTTFTVTYGAETASCLVEYCTYVNYLVDNEHDDNSRYNTGTVTYDKIGATLDATTFSSNNYQLNFIPLNDMVTVPYEVKYEILDNDTNNFRIYFYNNNFSGNAIGSGSVYRQNQQPTSIRFVVTSSGITRYIGNTSTELTVSTSIASKVGVRFGYWQPTKGKMKVRNFRIKPL